eukprot:9315045-Pyramimonas_sp.AAC.1
MAATRCRTEGPSGYSSIGVRRGGSGPGESLTSLRVSGRASDPGSEATDPTAGTRESAGAEGTL